MAKRRFRDVKQGKEKEVNIEEVSPANKRDYASTGSKIKAFLTDAFMLVMPIMYVVFYLIMGGREGFAEHKALGWVYILVPLVIVQTIFMFKTGQTPGYRAYKLTLIDDSTGEKPSLFITLFRNLCAVLSLFTLFGWVMMFFRKDSKTLHDLLSRTAVIYKSEIIKNDKFALVGVYVIFMPKVLLELGYSTIEVGIIYAAAPFMRFLLPFIFRHYLALTPKVYLLSLLFTFIGTLLFLVTVESFWVYLLANLLFGAAMGISLPYIETIALASLSKSHYGKVRLWGSLGFMGIALWLGKVLESPYEVLYYLSAMAFLTFIFGTLLTKYDTTSHESTQDDATFSLSKYWAFWVSIFLMQVGFGGFYDDQLDVEFWCYL